MGGGGRVWESGATRLRLKGEALQTEMEVEGSDELEELSVDASRVRVAPEASQAHSLAGGGLRELWRRGLAA